MTGKSGRENEGEYVKRYEVTGKGKYGKKEVRQGKYTQDKEYMIKEK